MKEAFDGWYYDPGSTCGSRCLVYSLGAPFGAGPAAAGGSRVGPGSTDGKRWLWIFFYRNLVRGRRGAAALLPCCPAALQPCWWWFQQRAPHLGCWGFC